MDVLIATAGNIALLVWGLHMTRTGLLRGYGARLRRAELVNTMKLGTTAFLTFDTRLADEVIAGKQQVRQSVQASINAHFGRIVDRSGPALSTSGVHLDVLRDLKRINSHLVAACHRTLSCQRDAIAPVDASWQK